MSARTCPDTGHKESRPGKVVNQNWADFEIECSDKENEKRPGTNSKLSCKQQNSNQLWFYFGVRCPAFLDFRFLVPISDSHGGPWNSDQPNIWNRFLTVPIKLPSRENPTPEINRANVIPYFVLTQKYKTFPAIPKIIPTTAGIFPLLLIVQTRNDPFKTYWLH